MAKRLIPKGLTQLITAGLAPDMSDTLLSSSTYVARDTLPKVVYQRYHEPVISVQDDKLTVSKPSAAEVSWRKTQAAKADTRTEEEKEKDRINQNIIKAQLELENDPVYRFARTAGDIVNETRHFVPAMLMNTGIPLLFGAGAAWEGMNLAYDAYHNDTPGMYRSILEPAGFAVLDAAMNPATYQFLGNAARNAGSYTYNRAINPVAQFVNNRVVRPATEWVSSVPSRVSSIFTKEEPLVSELDWSPESWFGERAGKIGYDTEDVEALESHIPEYREIERIAKENGTWLKMPDGSVWEGDPRSWVLMLSKAYKAYNPTGEVWYHGNRFDDEFLRKVIEGKDYMWGSSNPEVGRTYVSGKGRRVIPFVMNRDPDIIVDANGNNWSEILRTPKNKAISTADFSSVKSTDNNIIRINNVVDPGGSIYPSSWSKIIKGGGFDKFYLGDDIVLGKNISRKALTGNNGNFDITNPNMYKVLPFILGGTGALLFEKNNKLVGDVEKY